MPEWEEVEEAEGWAMVMEVLGKDHVNIAGSSIPMPHNLPPVPGVRIAVCEKKCKYQGFYPGAKMIGMLHESHSWAWPGGSLGCQTAGSKEEAYEKVRLWLWDVYNKSRC